MAERRHQLGDVLNEAVRHKPSNDPAHPLSAHLTYADIFWDILLDVESASDTSHEFNQTMNYILTQSKRDVRVERALWFISFAFGRHLDSEDARKRFLSNAYLGTLCDRSQCELKTVRFRCCQSMRWILDQVPDQSEIDEEVAASVYEVLMLRVRDRGYDVRTHALYALDRFKSAGDDQCHSGDPVVETYMKTMRYDPHPNPRTAAMNCLPLIEGMYDRICERTNDVSEIVRIAAFRIILSKMLPDAMSERCRGDIVRKGLNDRSDLVRRYAEKTVLHWFDEIVHKDPEQLLKLFGWSHLDVLPLVLSLLLEERQKEVVTWTEATEFRMNDLSDWDALFWKTLLCGLRQKADVLGQSAATDVDSAAAAQSLFDAIDRLLPSSFTEFLYPLEAYFDNDDIQKCYQLMIVLIDSFNLTDEGDRQSASLFFDRLCRRPLDQDIPDWYPSVMRLGSSVWQDTDNFVATVLEALEPFVHGEEDLLKMGHWLRASAAMLRCIPLKTPDVFDLGSTAFTIDRLFESYQSSIASLPDSSPLKQWSIQGLGILLTFRLPPDGHLHVQRLRDLIESREATTAAAAVDAVCTLTMSCGTRSIDRKRQLPPLSHPFPAVWECRLFNLDGEGAIPIDLMNMLHWDRALDGVVKMAVVRSLCRLLTVNNVHGVLGMQPGECIQCLCPLVMLFVFEFEGDREATDEIQQLLKVFFDRYAQANILHQYLLRAGFLPVLRYCLEMTTSTGVSITPAVKFLGNLLLAPLRGRQPTDEEDRDGAKERGRMNAQLMLVLLWEMVGCPTDYSASKTYAQSIWKLIMDIRTEETEDSQKLIVLSLAEDLLSGRRLQERQCRLLRTKLGVPEGMDLMAVEEIEALKEQLDAYIEQLGTHPFSDDD